MMQFGALTLLLTVAAARRPEQARWRHLAALAAALATGTKYPAGLLLIPVLLVCIFASTEKRSSRGTAVVVVKEVLIYAAAFLITTPGAVLQPWAFLRALVVEGGWYSQGHWGYTIPAGALHLGRMLDYLGWALLSPFPVIAGLLSLAAVAGAWWVWKESRLLAGVLLLFPMIYVAFFASQRVMIVRNLLVLAPFMAILAGRGIFESIRRSRWQQGRWAMTAIVAAMLALQAAWLVHAAETIHGRSLDDPGADLAGYIRSRRGENFWLSQRVKEEVAKPGEELPANALAENGNADFVAVYAYEAMPNLEWPANLRTLTVRTFGPLEVNFNYYPTWEGNDRIVLMTFERACSVGVDFVESLCP
jgi:4-amino-4-deoxy-L-arabinose transferase-like glycosyltransferase